ncbi:methyl-accepting chemotaxis protein [Salinarimonas soli]|uniref:Methyl-accepting chemotaxis protein n=1 Tax=Salinarimonas soli TaxID=1638099 RepID=A0A5B2VFB8_9HYPH|nr:methyl-accepting chemotaxis protein [Salinarimonas soli]KAA2237565.1 methyl-accepting chemotaxis protein [Salinarimonas soli]
MWKHRSLRWSITLAINAVVAAAIASAVMIYGSNERRKATEGLAEKIAATMAPIRDGAAQALHMSDPSTAEYLATALRTDADFVGAVILGPDLFVRLRVGRNDAVEDELHLDTVQGWLGGGVKEVLGAGDLRLVAGPASLTEVVALRPPVARQRVVGYLVAHYSTERLSARTRDSITAALALGGGFLLLLNGVLALLLWRFTTPMVDLSRATQALADGRLDLDVPHARRRDEIGAIARAIAVFQAAMVDRMRLQEASDAEQRSKTEREARVARMIAEFRLETERLVDGVGRESDSLEAAARSLAEAIGTSRHLTGAAVEEIAAARAQVENVAGAAEDMARVVGDIERQIGEARRIVGEASETNAATGGLVHDLALKADTIGEVVTLIRSIAEQTNLLALNATIEAARAGEAGKGFAVVASEVKALAGQTAAATHRIAEQIAAIQAGATSAAASITAFSTSIGAIESVTAQVASAVARQTGAMDQISGDAAVTSGWMGAVSRHIGELVASMESTERASGTVDAAARSLTRGGGELRGSIGRFLQGVTAAR